MMSIAACGKSDNARFVEGCVAEGNDEAICTCVVDKFEADVSNETFKLLADSYEAGGDKGDALLNDLPTSEQIGLSLKLMNFTATCVGDAASE